MTYQYAADVPAQVCFPGVDVQQLAALTAYDPELEAEALCPLQHEDHAGKIMLCAQQHRALGIHRSAQHYLGQRTGEVCLRTEAAGVSIEQCAERKSKAIDVVQPAGPDRLTCLLPWLQIARPQRLCGGARWPAYRVIQQIDRAFLLFYVSTAYPQAYSVIIIFT